MTRYKLDDLAREAEVTPRTVRYYVQRGLLPPPDFHGSQTTYGPEHLLRLRVVRRLQQEYLPLEAIHARMAASSTAELERLADGEAPAELLPSPPVVTAGGSVLRSETWERIALLPGLEIHVRADATPLARRLAREIETQFSPSASFESEE